ncbi:hypothetical protein [Actinophytocola xanthii]|uniref:Ricin B lectin domain-containing protein n=1 Tax=Actinophytocola xanthii TaxID=1912961 RepID=A0A1Q8CM95_9PSEU|nr:hypothetical protein [Actinophytocola xanthii]OLF15465.1 hypothetical protein BU204_21270 [Actinophytocola xanthii]
MRLLITTCATALLTVGVAPGAAATPSAPEPACDTPSRTATETVVSTADGRTLWTYTHSVRYCVEGGKIYHVDDPTGDVTIIDESCGSDNRLQDWSKGEPGGETVNTFTMGLVSCDPPDAEPYQVNPWVILDVAANGNHEAKKGIQPR